MEHYNLIVDVREEAESGAVSEPVSLAEMKDYMRLTGFSGIESVDEFTFDDDLIERLIRAARHKIEQYCGISIVNKSLVAHIKNYAGDTELPFGPVVDVDSVTDIDGNEINFTVVGTDFKIMRLPQQEVLVSYRCGYDSIPDEIIVAIQITVAYWYENRAGEKQLPLTVMDILSKYKRGWTWLG